MPTGYTADVATGKITSLREFAMTCARGMGALVMMRDDPSGAAIPERFEPSDFQKKALAEAKAELAKVQAMSADEATAAAEAEYAAALARREERLREDDERTARYDAMIAKVEAWAGAPEGLKEFMLDQLRQSKDFDCYTPEARLRYMPEPTLTSGTEWRHAQEIELLRRVRYCAGEWEAEVARVEGRNAWIAQLRAALSRADGGTP